MDNDLVEKVAREIDLVKCHENGLEFEQILFGKDIDAIARAAIAAYEAARPLELIEVLGATNARRVDLLEKRARELEESLKPFADRAEQWALNKDSARVSVRLGDLRRARAAYEGKK